MDKKFLHYKLIPDNYLDSSGKIKEESKYKINIPELKIKDSKFIPNPGDKFETMLFLPPNSNRIAEGGLRTKGLFKFSYKKVKSDFEENKNNASENDGIWYICDLDGNPAIPAPDDLQEKINQYTSRLSSTTFLPLITVITVVYNGAKYLEDTIKSVINQTYPNVEYIIIDGGSTDGTIDIIKKYEDYIDYWVSEPDKGIYDAMNKGIDLTAGQWINFMNAGDRFYDENLIEEIFSKDIKKNVFIYGNAILMPLSIIQKQENWHLDILKRIIHQSIFTPLTCLKKKKFNLKYRIMADYDLIRYCINESKVVYIDKIICYYDYNGVSSKPLFYYFHEYLEISKKYSSNMIEKFKIYLHIIPRVIYSVIRFQINHIGGYIANHKT
jgi:hypothetical protein